MQAAMRWERGRLEAAEVALAAAAVIAGVAVEHLVPKAATRNSHPIVVARHRREVTNDHERLLGLLTLAQKANHAGLKVVAVDPFEALVAEIDLVQRRL